MQPRRSVTLSTRNRWLSVHTDDAIRSFSQSHYFVTCVRVGNVRVGNPLPTTSLFALFLLFHQVTLETTRSCFSTSRSLQPFAKVTMKRATMIGARIGAAHGRYI